MKNAPLALIAAMPQETKPLLRRVGSPPTESLAGFPCYRFTLDGRECCLIESGMGPGRAGAAARTLVAAVSPRLLVNFGFAGAVAPGPAVGDIVVAQRVLCRHDRLFTEEKGLSLPCTESLVAALEEEGEKAPFAVFRGTFVTTVEIVVKGELARSLPATASHPVLEMETAAVARVAQETTVPLVALRAISDDAGEELDFAITDFTDREMNLRLGKVFLTVVRKPRIIPQLLRLARNSRSAAENLALALEKAITAL